MKQHPLEADPEPCYPTQLEAERRGLMAFMDEAAMGEMDVERQALFDAQFADQDVT